MHIMISGGSGLLGHALIHALVKEGHSVVVLSRHPAESGLAASVPVVAWDAKTPQGWGERVNEMDAIINLAGANIGAGRWTQARKQAILQSRIHAGQAIVAAVQQAQRKPAVVIQASGIGAYGNTQDRVVDENAPRGSDFLAHVTEGWEASTAAVEREGVRHIVIRTGLAMPRQGGWIAPLRLAFRFFLGGPLGSGMQWWPWIHIHDYVGAVNFLLKQANAQGIYNLSAPHPAQMRDFGRALGRVMHRPYWFPAPAFGLRLLLGEMSVLVLEGQRAIPARLMEAGFSFQYPDLQPALNDLYG